MNFEYFPEFPISSSKRPRWPMFQVARAKKLIFYRCRHKKK
jgi:hypothetical protein